MTSKNDDDQVIIFDTTLRDGEQSPGASMNLSEKLTVAQALADLGVDVIEAGFPAASTGDFESVRDIARQIKGPTIAGLARCHKGDIDRSFEALKHAEKSRIHVFLATSPIHREFKLKMNRDQVLQRAHDGIAHAASMCKDVEFSAEDAARTEPDFLVEVVTCAINAGATTINIPDTVGYAMPDQFGGLIRYLIENAKNSHKAIFSVHCHNDLGMAVANSLAAISAGARQVEGTINGIGERAGNCSLEELIMALRTRRDVYGINTGVKTRQIYATSQLVSSVTGIQVQRNKAIVGANAFAHEAGIHQHGMLMNKETYEIMKPEDVGVVGNQLILGKHSGRHALQNWIAENGYQIDEARIPKIFQEFKALADRKKELYDADLHALIEGGLNEEDGPWMIEAAQTSGGTGSIPTAAVCLRHTEDDSRHEEAATGDGPVEALYKAIERVVGVRVQLKRYQLRSVTRGKDAMGDVSIQVLIDGTAYHGHAVSTDIIEASGRALLNVLNRYIKVHSAREKSKKSA